MVQARDLDDHAKKQTDPQYADSVLVMRNCAIESFLLHYRALRDFFSSQQKMKADAISKPRTICPHGKRQRFG